MVVARPCEYINPLQLPLLTPNPLQKFQLTTMAPSDKSSKNQKASGTSNSRARSSTSRRKKAKQAILGEQAATNGPERALTATAIRKLAKEAKYKGENR